MRTRLNLVTTSLACIEPDPIEYKITRIGNAVQSHNDETDRLRCAAGAEVCWGVPSIDPVPTSF
jgi:hypothetical protein